MNNEDKQLQSAFRKVLEKDSIPAFELTWRAARKRVEQKPGLSIFRWTVGPSFVAVAAAFVLLLTWNQGPSSEMLASLNDLGELDAGSFMLDELVEGDSIWTANTNDEEEDSEEADKNASPTGDLFAGETDFLLTMEIASFDVNIERKVQ